MLNLKLAEYNLETGKFERFLELGKDFLYGGEYIHTMHHDIRTGLSEMELYSFKQKDKKDPLNRFNGLFDGRTYGDGRFVLLWGLCGTNSSLWTDEIAEPNLYREKHSLIAFDSSLMFTKPCAFSYVVRNYLGMQEDTKICGNLHQNPELFERIK